MKTVVITGGSDGMGKAAATILAKKGYRIIIHGSTEAKTRQAAEEIKTKSGNSNVDFVSADVSLIKGTKELADAIKRKTDSIHILILSTGIILPNHVITPDGLEKGFSVQYLSRFAVTQLLMPELKKGNARIVHVGAPVLKSATIYFDDLALRKNFTMFRALGQEMLANHLFVQEFAKRIPELPINIFHVGIVKTGIMRNVNFLMRLPLIIFGKSPEKATKNMIYLADDPGASFSGYFLPKPGNPSARNKISHDPSIAEKLWNKSLDLIKPIL